MTVIPKPHNPTESFTGYFDAWNRLVELTDDADSDNPVADYAWDGLGRRIVEVTYDAGVLEHTRHFYYSDQHQSPLTWP